MVWILAAVIIFALTYLFSGDSYHFSDNLFAAVMVGVLLVVLGNTFSLGFASEETTVSYNIATPIERSIVNDEVVLTFTTDDDKRWSLPSDTETVVGSEDTLTIHRPLPLDWFWTVIHVAKPEYKTLTVSAN